ncbi:hypothetical protein PG985_009492 [Apiospora marii]|uniref:uncharacterized protein n=1 Tax=Apiospora marii TaxID=335849 RepID=UPI00312EA62D
MYNLKLATLGLMATAALPTQAYLPPHKRSESAVDLGTLESLEAFYQHLGLDAATGAANWQPIEEPETHDWDAIAAETPPSGPPLPTRTTRIGAARPPRPRTWGSRPARATTSAPT